MAVVLNALALAFNDLIDTVALAAVVSQFAGLRDDHGLLIALSILKHIDAGAPNQDAAFGDDDVAREDTALLEVVIAQGIRLGVHGHVAVGFFSHGRKRRQQGQSQQQGGEVVHKGTNLAQC